MAGTLRCGGARGKPARDVGAMRDARTLAKVMQRPAEILPDVLAPGLRIVFCGVAPGRVSAARRAYYAGPGNKFWPTLHRIGLTPRLFAPHEYPDVLPLGIGLTDVCKIAFGADHELAREAFDAAGFLWKMERYRPRAVAFDGKFAAKMALGVKTIPYGRQPETLHGATLFVLPSPSGRARRFWDERYWFEVAGFVREIGAR
jgi:double-stranded uracil-DNA glycosylase